jgi:hypothetical protein
MIEAVEIDLNGFGRFWGGVFGPFVFRLFGGSRLLFGLRGRRLVRDALIRGRLFRHPLFLVTLLD